LKDLLTAFIVIIALLFLLPLLGVSTNIFFEMIEWSTKFILPWLGLYWFVELVKTLDQLNKKFENKIENDEV
jgi:hypothetical protein